MLDGGSRPAARRARARALRDGGTAVPALARSGARARSTCAATRFAADRCPVYFKHSNWTSFARMLNMLLSSSGGKRGRERGLRTSALHVATGPGSRARGAEEAGVNNLVVGGNRRRRQVIGPRGCGAGSGVRDGLASPPGLRRRRPARGGERAAQGRARRRRPEATRAVRPHSRCATARRPQTTAVGAAVAAFVILCSTPVRHRRGRTSKLKGPAVTRA